MSVRTRWLVGVGLSVLLIAAALFPTLWGRPWSIDHFFSRVFLEFALERPMVLSQLRLLEPYGLDYHADDLDDFSVEFERDEIREIKKNLSTLRRYDRDSLSESQRLSAEVLEWFLEMQAERERFLLHDYPVNQANGVQTGLPNFMLNTHQLNTAEDAENYLRRLAKFGVALDQVSAGLSVRQEAGVVPPRFVIERVRAQIAGFLSPPAEEHLLRQHLAASLEEIEDLDDDDREALLAQALDAMQGEVYPGYARLDATLAALGEVATDDHGVWKLPDGDAYYAFALRRHTTTDLSADEMHRLGLSEVERLHGEMRAILKREGARVEDPIAAVRMLAVDPRFLFPDTDEGREAILQGYRAIVEAAKAKLPDIVGRQPRAGVEVERVPEFMEGGRAARLLQPAPLRWLQARGLLRQSSQRRRAREVPHADAGPPRDASRSPPPDLAGPGDGGRPLLPAHSALHRLQRGMGALRGAAGG